MFHLALDSLVESDSRTVLLILTLSERSTIVKKMLLSSLQIAANPFEVPEIIMKVSVTKIGIPTYAFWIKGIEGI